MPVFLRITIQSKRIEKATSKFVDPSKWCERVTKLKGNSEEARLINGHLERMRTKVFELEKKLISKDQNVDFLNFRNDYLGKVEQVRTIIPIFQEHNDRIKALLGTEYAPETLERYETSLKHTQEFLE